MDRVRRRWPDIKIAGHHGFFDMAEGSTQNGAVIGAINAAACDVLLVGMGMPRQEHWIAANRSAINAKVILATGGFMDYFAGEIPTPPRLLARVGLEWLFRLRDEPRRLWKRYLVEPWLLMHIIVMDAIRRRGKKA
jgi:N-acetylglucosaminyldiphosphoundecaprenol N-acetyl-beta-D-mannosaminyltransferase